MREIKTIRLEQFVTIVEEYIAEGAVDTIKIMVAINELAINPYYKYRYITASIYKDGVKALKYYLSIKHYYNKYSRGTPEVDVKINKIKIKQIMKRLNIEVVDMN